MSSRAGLHVVGLVDTADRVLIRDLGTLQIVVEGRGQTAGGALPAKILTMLLIQANRRVSSDSLVAAIWGEDVVDPRKAVGSLESHIWRLRKLMEPRRRRGEQPIYLVKDIAGYRLVVNPDSVDSLRFVDLARQGDAFLQSQEPRRALETYDRALGLWRGRPFEDVADEQWAASAITELEVRYDHVQEQRVEALIQCGEPEQALLRLEVLLEVRPFRERLWQQLMLTLYQCGRVDEALNAYLRARRALLDHVGVDPGPELVRLHQRMLDRDPVLTPERETAPRRPSAVTLVVNLPTRLSPLIGRQHELDRLAVVLQESRLVTLIGPGGCGKTRLAIELARRPQHSWADGIFFIDLTAVEHATAVATAMVSAMGITSHAVGDALSAMRSYVQDRGVLLVLDNCEHVLDEVRRIAASLLSDDSLCRVLATSREPIGIDGEVSWAVAPLAVRRETDPGVSLPSEAAQLFWSRARATTPDLAETVHGAALVEQICAGVDGLPLAVELAAGRLRTSSLAEIAHQVRDGLVGLGREGFTETSHHQTVQSSIEWSTRLLDSHELTIHARLSVLPGVFTVETASAVVGFGEVRREAVPELLRRLTYRSLLAPVAPTSDDEPTRFRQLATVQAHARSLLDSREETGTTLRSRTDWLATLLDDRPDFEAFDPENWHARVRRDFDSVAAVLQQTLVDHPEPFGVHATARLWFYFFSDRFVEGQRWMTLALAQHDGETADRVEIQLGLASALLLRDRTDLAVPLIQQALEAAALVDPRRLGEGLTSAAYNAWLRNHPELEFVRPVLAALAARTDDPALRLYVDLIAALDKVTVAGPAAVAMAAGHLDRRATELGQQWTARSSSWLGLICALLSDDAVRATTFCRSSVERSLQVTGTVDHVIFEARGDTAIIAGDVIGGVRLLSCSQKIAHRHGNLWPLTPLTAELLDRARTSLPSTVFDEAWRDGDEGRLWSNP